MPDYSRIIVVILTPLIFRYHLPLTLFFFICFRSFAQSCAREESGLPYVRWAFHIPSKIFAAFAPYFALAHFPIFPILRLAHFPHFLLVRFLHFLFAHFICVTKRALSGPWISRPNPGSRSAWIRVNILTCLKMFSLTIFSQVKKLVFENDLPKTKVIKTTTNVGKKKNYLKRFPTTLHWRSGSGAGSALNQCGSATLAQSLHYCPWKEFFLKTGLQKQPYICNAQYFALG